MPPKVRGKFLSAPSQSQSSNTSNDTPSSSQTRGKFLGKKPVSPGGGLNTATSSIGGSGDTVESTTQLKDHIHNSKIAAAARRKAIAGQRQLVLDDLNEAENIVLSLLECASDVSSALSAMTTAKSKNRKRDESSSDAAEKTGEKSFEDLTAEVRSNGVGYLAGVKKLHKLLAPHSSLVKSYKNHDRGESSSTGESDKQQSLAVTSAAGGTNSTSSKLVEEATSNMYAVRVKKRLAMEKSEILQEIIRLEEMEEVDCSETQQSGGVEEKDSANTEKVRSKRKRK